MKAAVVETVLVSRYEDQIRNEGSAGGLSLRTGSSEGYFLVPYCC